ncbi:hypothetical protein SDC9_111022 [bioreactor metagenome]|uniref:Uncharacterized protein n=1 Tax=bioreactor metagenome TaxID=1076179 RepID=A0A645BG66_9ZZZZ
MCNSSGIQCDFLFKCCTSRLNPPAAHMHGTHCTCILTPCTISFMSLRTSRNIGIPESSAYHAGFRLSGIGAPRISGTGVAHSQPGQPRRGEHPGGEHPAYSREHLLPALASPFFSIFDLIFTENCILYTIWQNRSGSNEGRLE